MLSKLGSGNCPGSMSQQEYTGHNFEIFEKDSDVCHKLEVFERNADGGAGKVWIRNDRHPQRSFAVNYKDNTQMHYYSWNSKSATEPHWEVEFEEVKMSSESPKTSPVYLVAFRSIHTDKYLSAEDCGDGVWQPCLSKARDLWSLKYLSGAFSPGECGWIAGGSVVAAAATAATLGAATGAVCAAGAASTAATLAAETATVWGVLSGAAAANALAAAAATAAAAEAVVVASVVTTVSVPIIAGSCMACAIAASSDAKDARLWVFRH